VWMGMAMELHDYCLAHDGQAYLKKRSDLERDLGGLKAGRLMKVMSDALGKPVMIDEKVAVFSTEKLKAIGQFLKDLDDANREALRSLAIMKDPFRACVVGVTARYGHDDAPRVGDGVECGY
jgi:hypothetical protein